ncbi:MAG: L-aspartate oxidase [Verrucomicrobia bacterium]|nr:MAG: L-aspartate oxidase [Verrucomicrobiota bacterium]
MREVDFIVIGSGIAGLTFALKAASQGHVVVVTKRGRAESNTAGAQGGIACVSSEEDSFELHIRDTLTAGAGLCNEAVVRRVVTEAPGCIAELIQMGVEFDRYAKGNIGHDLGKEGGHSKRRVLHVQDFTGLAIERALLRRVSEHPNIELLENHMAVDFITMKSLSDEQSSTQADVCVGVYVLNERTGIVETLRSDVTFLATGGCGKAYLYTTNPDVATGDGVAMAWRAGAVISNMEFIQFHPTCLYHAEAKSFLISEAVRGEGAILIDARGERFMQKYHPLAELAPRDIVARAIDAEMKQWGSKCVYLDITHKSADFIKRRFPKVYETCLKYGFDLTQRPVPVVPAAHYQCGGVKTDLNGETTIAGLYAAGEVACTGLHGANRLASNSLLEAVVLANLCFKKIMNSRPSSGQKFALPKWQSSRAEEVSEMVIIYHNWDEIRRIMWDYVGIVRNGQRLQQANARLRALHAEIQGFYQKFKPSTDLLELRNLITVASLIVKSAIQRKESRGLHYTLDFPEKNDSNYLHDTDMRIDPP